MCRLNLPFFKKNVTKKYTYLAAMCPIAKIAKRTKSLHHNKDQKCLSLAFYKKLNMYVSYFLTYSIDI